jgi:CRISPR system Cascade subunit CasD
MSVLLLRLAGPMQSWGVQSRFSVRDTGREPSKSGVIGLLCAALGRRRTEAIDDLAALVMGVRVVKEGRLARDYHTALEVARAGGGLKDCEPSTRYYLADAEFIVGLESPDRALLEQLDAALRRPHWPLCLGRKSFVPGEPVAWSERDGAIQTGALREALTCDLEEEEACLILESTPAEGQPRMDQPVSFDNRTFTTRYVRTEVAARKG